MGFEFGLGFWILFFVIFFGCGRMCGWGVRKYRDRRRELQSEPDDSDRRLSELESRVRQLADRDRDRQGLASPAMSRRGRGAEPERARLKRRRTSPLQELQRKFVEGRLTLAEYERELDLLERLD
jgi:hypothetical protein